MVTDQRDVVDLTPPEGSKYRSVAIESKGSIYNQHGRKVNDVTFRVTESVKVYKDDKRPDGPPDFKRIWEAPNWMSREEHVYTDADWEQNQRHLAGRESPRQCASLLAGRQCWGFAILDPRWVRLSRQLRQSHLGGLEKVAVGQ